MPSSKLRYPAHVGTRRLVVEEKLGHVAFSTLPHRRTTTPAKPCPSSATNAGESSTPVCKSSDACTRFPPEPLAPHRLAPHLTP